MSSCSKPRDEQRQRSLLLSRRTTFVLLERRGLREMTRQTTILACVSQKIYSWLKLRTNQHAHGCINLMAKTKFPLIRLQRYLKIICLITIMDMLCLTASYSWFCLEPEISRLKGHKSLTSMPCRMATGTTTSLSMEMRESSCALWIMTLQMANSHMWLVESQVSPMNG